MSDNIVKCSCGWEVEVEGEEEAYRETFQHYSVERNSGSGEHFIVILYKP